MLEILKHLSFYIQEERMKLKISNQGNPPDNTMDVIEESKSEILHFIRGNVEDKSEIRK